MNQFCVRFFRDMPDSIELDTVWECISGLEEAVLQRDHELVHFLKMNDFINEREYDDIRDPQSMLSESEKSLKIVKWIRCRVKQDPNSYYTLVSYLSTHGCFKPIVKRLESTRTALQQKCKT